ncbi:anaerobic ribonucleoside-triphosphate reductase activating protein [Staphylococcus chromogenes]|nr:anaerobic ribonucleoside-triphosphate reductase activating protein [Staphylococcus chromogenes]
MNESTSTPELELAGIIPFSPSDWPGHLVATAFTQGCPLRCCYCHNPSLLPIQPGKVAFGELLSLLDERRGLLDGAVISGGEPLIQPGLPQAIAALHARGFLVGLHTSGYSAQRFRRLFACPETTPDWVGLDIKALPRDFDAVSPGRPRAATESLSCLRLLVDAHVECQIRTTIWPGSVLEEHLPELKELVASFGQSLHVQQVIDR